MINRWVTDEKDRLTVFDRNGPYLATKKIGKNNPKAEQIEKDNKLRMDWNREVDRAIISEVYAEYQQKTKDWKKSFGNTDNSMDKAETMSEKLARLQKEADSYRQYNRRMSNKLR